MKAKIIFFSCLFALAAILIAGQVKNGTIFTDLDYTGGVYVAGVDTTGTNKLVGYLPPKSSIKSIDIVVLTAFNAATNNYVNVLAIYRCVTNNVLTNSLVANHSVASVTGIHVPIVGGGGYTMSTNGTVAVYCNYEQNGTNICYEGAARIFVNYVQY
jgi:hypothetical protein